MPLFSNLVLCVFGHRAVATGLILCCASVAMAQTQADGDGRAIGRIDLESASLPPATIQIEMGPGMISDLLGLGKAAIAGATDTLIELPQGSETTRLAADQLVALQEIVQIASEVVQEVRIRVFEESSTTLSAQFANQLEAGRWDTIVRVHDGNESVELSLVRQDGAVRGIFVIVADGKDLVLVNVVCNVSPEMMKTLTAKAARIGLDNGLQHMLEDEFKRLHRYRQPSGN